MGVSTKKDPKRNSSKSKSVGGECTMALINAVRMKDKSSWLDLLINMRDTIKTSFPESGQAPKIASSRGIDLDQGFRLKHTHPNGNYRALLIGVDHLGSDSSPVEVRRDIEAMLELIKVEGYTDNDIKVLLDYGNYQRPTRDAIESGMQWLSKDAKPGDSLVFHYTSRGGFTWSEDDDQDEQAIFPMDYKTAGLLLDDDLFKNLIKPLQEGVHLTCVVDGGSCAIPISLPYTFDSDNAVDAQVQAGSKTNKYGRARTRSSFMVPDTEFDLLRMLELIKSHRAMASAAMYWGNSLQSMNPNRVHGDLTAVEEQARNFRRS